MIQKQPTSFFSRLYEATVMAGVDRARPETHHGIINNYFVLAFTFFVYFLMVLLLVYLVRLFEVDYDRYIEYVPPFVVLLLFIIIVLHGYFFLLNRSRFKPENLSAFVVLCGTVTIFFLSYLLGHKTYFFAYSFILLPIPFLIFKTHQKKYIAWCTVIVVTAPVLDMILWTINPEPYFPIPEEYYAEIQLIIVPALIVNFLLIGYIFWRENHRLQQELKKSNEELKEKDTMLQLELDFAADIQQGLMPPVEHQWKNVTLHSNLQPMHKVSGDFYDYFEYEDEMYVLLADISGHGVPAALVTMLAKQCFAARIAPGKSPAQIFSEVNDDMCRLLTTSDYLTAFMVRITKDEVEFCNAGHIPGVFLAAEIHDEFPAIDTPGLFIGSLEEASDSFQPGKRRYSKGDQILLMTDGITEAKAYDETEYTIHRLRTVLGQVKKHNSPKEIFEALLRDWHRFTAQATLRDDVTLLSITFD